MHRIAPFRLGAVFASLVAGPLLLVSILCSVAVIHPQSFFSLTTGQMGVFAGIFVASIPAGFLLSVLPILLCTALMYWLGRMSPDARSPVFWAGAGALLTGTAMIALEIVLTGGDRPLAVALEPTPIVMIPGALCGLIARARTVWREGEAAEREADP
jgi:hypothetical protein